MKKALMISLVLFVAVISTACINNIAVQELNNKAAEYMQKGDYEAAVSRLQASIDLDSSMYETYYNLGVAAINAKKYDVAVDALQKGIKLKPDFTNFYYSLGVAQFSLADDMAGLTDGDELSEEAVVERAANVTEADKEKAVKLKKLSILNFSRYLKDLPNAEDKSSVEEMISEAEKFIKANENIPQEESAQ